MQISALNFCWLTDPHDLQGIGTPSCVKLRSQNIITSMPRLHPVLSKQTLDEVVFPICREPPWADSQKRREKFPQ